jgi:uncharacterized membrane protein YraQ (UPF0718 family)
MLRAIYSTVNWVETNRKGMTFGVLFAASLMVILTLFQGKSFKSGFANSLLGMTIGAPLGVCVNCAAPIAKGLHAAGARAETTLAAMISSPTLNIIVLTMLFSLFPMYIVLIKLGLTVAVILIVIPLLVRVLRVRDVVLPADAEIPGLQADACPVPLGALDPTTTWRGAGSWVIRTFLTSLWFIVKKTVPLMFLAGFLGALLITILPWDTMSEIVTADSRMMVLVSMGVVALVGLTLPVPIAFDVIVSAILLSAGMEVKYVMVLLFTLGIFSIYAFFIIWGSMARRMVISLSVVLLGMGVGGGVAAHEYYKWDVHKQLDLFYEFGKTKDAPGPTISNSARSATGEPQAELVKRLRRDRLMPEPSGVSQTGGITIERIPFQARQEKDGKPFLMHEGSAMGLDAPFYYSVFSQLTITRYRGIATGDIHNDGWVDVLLTSPEGISLYANQQGRGFVLQQIEIPAVQDLFVVNAALVDLNNDGWLDVALSSYRKGNHLIYNRGGRFLAENMHPLPNHDDAVMTAGFAFGDVDRDGDLDVALGNWSVGILTGSWSAMASSRDALLRNEAGEYRIESLPGIVGETLSTLFSDINDDGRLDLIVGNDLGPPDNYYLGTESGELRLLTREDDVIEHSAGTTMSITSADIDNDLRLEIYIGQISGRAGDTALEMRRAGPDLCEDLRDSENKKQCEHNQSLHADIVRSRSTRSIRKCLSMDPDYHDDCIAVLMLQSAGQRRDPKLCELFPESWEMFAFVCNSRFGEKAEPTPEDKARAIRQRQGNNVLLVSADDGRFVDRSVEHGVAIGGWTWNAKFADLDNDEWQDLFIVNGPSFLATREPNLFYRNEGGGKLVDRTTEFGLASYLAASAYSYIDMDNDGDLDIIVVPASAPLLVYENNGTEGKSIAFELRDHVGNRSGIGSKIIIHYGPGGGRHQLREIQASGGFISFDAPVAYFGLGEFDEVERLEIRWSTGERSELQGGFPAGARYIVTRGGEATAGDASASRSGGPADRG